MDEIMDIAALAAEQRETATEQKNQLISDNIDEVEAFAGEYNMLAAYIDEQNVMLEESISKAAKAVKFDDAVDDDDVNQRGKLTVEKEKEIQNEMAEIDQQMDDGRRTMRNVDQRIINYQQNFEDLRRASNLKSTDDIVDTFMKNEEETFSLFNFIQTLNQETDLTLEQHARLEEEILAYANDQKAQESNRLATVENYNKQVEEAKEERRKMTILAMDEQKTVEKIAKKVQTLFYKIQCDQLLESGAKGGKGGAVSSESRMAVLSGQGVSESNILHFMGLIEERAVQVIGEYVRKLSMSREGRRPSVMGGSLGSITKAANDAAGHAAGVPNIEDFEATEEDSDDDEKPLSMTEMKKRVEDKVVQVKEKRARGGHRNTQKVVRNKSEKLT